MGTDTARYLRHIRNLQSNTSRTSFSTEPGLGFLSMFTSVLIKDPQFTLVVIALIINGLIILRLWKLKSQISFSFAVFIYTTTYYAMTFSGIRQWLAISIIFFGSKYIFELKYSKFVFSVLIASLFHNSAILALILLPLDMLTSKLKYRKQKVMFSLLLLLAPFLVGGLLLVDSRSNLLSQYSGYVQYIGLSKSTGVMVWIRILMGLLVCECLKRESLPDSSFTFKIFNIYILGLLVSVPGHYVPNLSRIGWYFTIFETIMFGIIAHNRRQKMSFLLTVFIGGFSVLVFVLELAGSGRGHVPYIPFWK